MLMHSGTLYLATVLIWGSTWYAVKFQLGVVEAEISIAYRFFLAAIILFAFCLWRRKNLRFSITQHMFIALQGLFLFSTNYLLFYWASGLLTSGIVALLFSTMVLMNIVNGALFLGKTVNSRVIAGAILGMTGIAAIFWSELSAAQNNADSWRGLWLCLIATLLASIGNILSARNQQNHLPVLQTNAWGMAYGSAIMAVYALIIGVDFNYDSAVSYNLSLAYLSLFGTIFAFGSYLTLVGRIGADKAAYTTVLFPVIALGISTLFEGYQWSIEALFGFGLILLGNYLVLMKASVVKAS